LSDVLNRIRAEEQSLWIPGAGEVNPKVTRLQRAVEAYDERLVLARHNVTGDWVIFIKLEGGNLYPVLGIGRELPDDPEEIRYRLYKADARRHGTKILDDINRANERILAEKRYAADEAIGETAEWLEWGIRQEGWHPSPRVFIPRGI